jgi:hypothetical protein
MRQEKNSRLFADTRREKAGKLLHAPSLAIPPFIDKIRGGDYITNVFLENKKVGGTLWQRR